MDEISTIEYLLFQTKKEMEKLEKFQSTTDLKYWNGTFPSKQKIKDNLKMIRRIALDLSKQF